MSGFITSVPNLAILTFRDAIREISPRWLKHGLAEKILYSFGIHLDTLTAMAEEGVKKRFPLFLDALDALPLTGHDRKIARGFNESDIGYVNRLLTWLDDHKTRGGPYALLIQLARFWSVGSFDIDLVYESGKRFHMPANSVTVSESTGSPWDGNVAQWARWWLVFNWPVLIGTDGIWSDPGTWEDGGVWDADLSSTDVENIRLVPREWNAEHPIGYVVLRNGGAELWDVPAGLWSDPGVWGDSAGISEVTLTVA